MKILPFYLLLLILIIACDQNKDDTDQEEPPYGKYQVWYSSTFIASNNYFEFIAGNERRDSSIIGPYGMLGFRMNEGDSMVWKIWGDNLYQDSETYIVIGGEVEVFVRCRGDKKMESRYLIEDTLQAYDVQFVYKSDVPGYSYGYTLNNGPGNDFENGNGMNVISISAMSGDTLTTYINSGLGGTGEAVIMLNGHVAARVIGTEGDFINYKLWEPVE